MENYAQSLFDHLCVVARGVGRKLTKSEWLAATQDHYATNHPPKPAKIARKAPRSEIDEVWLAELEANPTYAGIDVKRELGKAQAWASVNGLGVSRMRFINWLNRAVEKLPVAVNGQGLSSLARKPVEDPEPYGWREWVRKNATDPSWAERQWNELDSTARNYIREQLRKGNT
jgi:hypothetical protein